ncbi:MAG: photosystem II reaction center protein Psb28 [Pseudanabaenaceae cyanobacterium]
MTAVIQLSRGINEEATNVKITRSRDGSVSIATFSFEQPNCWNPDRPEALEITGMFMLDEEGEISTRNVSAKYMNGKLTRVEAVYKMQGEAEWQRFLRFMNRYAEANGMGFTKA